MMKRQKRQLGDLFGLRNFGVNLTRIAPGGASALRHVRSAILRRKALSLEKAFSMGFISGL